MSLVRAGDDTSYLLMVRALHDALRGLRSPLTDDELAATALGLLAPVSAIGTTLLLVDRDHHGEIVGATVAAAGINRQFRRLLCPLSPDTRIPPLDAIRERRNVYLGTRDEIVEQYRVYEPLDPTAQAIAAMPLGTAAASPGALAISFEIPLEFNTEMRMILDEVADITAHLVDLGSRTSARAGDLDGSSRFDRLTLDRSGHRVLVDDRPITLTRLEYDVLRTLVDHRGQVLSKDQLLEHVWGYDGYNHNVVEAQISSLRRKLGPAGALIETVRGFGYVVR